MAEEEIYNRVDSSFSKETILHKSIKDTRPDLLQCWFASQNWDDVNTGNRWSQTPLHYAAIKTNTYVLEVLLQVPRVDVTKQDLNGYNVLHSLIYNIVAIDDWQRTIQVLLSLGIDINQQTKHGYSILHLASRNTIPPRVLRFILESCAGLNVAMINKDGENFLHSFVHSINKTSPVSDEFKDRFALLDDIVRGKVSCCAEKNLITLLKQRDLNGTTPFLLIINHFDRYRNVNAIKVLRKMAVAGGCSTIADNLGNHPIHYAIACLRKTPIKMLQMLIETGADANAKNIYEQSTAHLVRVDSKDLTFERIKSIVNVMKTTDIDFNASDKWGCFPLMYISAFYDSDCLPFLNDITSTSTVLNAVDNSGSSALHYAAYHDSGTFVNLLIQNGARNDIKDKLGESPIETAKRHLRISSEEALLESSTSEELNDKNQQFLENFKSLQTSKKIEMNMDQFVEELLNHKYRNAGEEEEQINSTICFFVELLCKQVSKYDPRFEMTVFQSGSSKEKTKVNAPDEFDFVLCLDKISEFCDIEERKSTKERKSPRERKGHKERNTPNDKINNNVLKLKLIEGHQDVLEFFDENGILISPPIFMYLHKYLKQALHDPSVWKNDELRNLCYVFEMPFLQKDMKTTVFMVRLLWFGCKHKQLRIKIDMVPAIRKTAWWSIDPNSLPMMTQKIRDAGCLLLLDTTSDEQSFTSEYLKEFIVDTIDRIRPVQTNLRVSTAPAEVCLMETFPQIVRDSYALAKLFVDICNVTDISSYMLKNCTFHVLQELRWNPNMPDDISKLPSLMELTVQIFMKLLAYNKTYFLPRFFLPEVNIFPQDQDIQDKQHEKWEIKFILKILGQNVTLDSDESDDYDDYHDDDASDNDDYHDDDSSDDD